VVVPRAEWCEAVERRSSSAGVESLRKADWLRVVDNPSPVDLGLDPGETATILVAESLRADLLLIDERVGRPVAQKRGLAVRGTLGVLVQVRQLDVLLTLEPALMALVAEGFRLAPLIRQAHNPVGERADADDSGRAGPGSGALRSERSITS
jgi:predicted nucleic acid-binding protein